MRFASCALEAESTPLVSVRKNMAPPMAFNTGKNETKTNRAVEYALEISVSNMLHPQEKY